MSMRSRIPWMAVAGFLLGLGLFVVLWPTGRRQAPPGGYTPLRDDGLAARYCPAFEAGEAFGPILAVYYRAARDAAGVLHLAYHPAWAREVNPGPGLGPLLSRTIYTGGLSLQRAMFGRGDIECIGLAIDPAGTIVQVEYERARGYDPRAFSVTHEKVAEKGPFDLPLGFRVMSWNHLFAREDRLSGGPSQAVAPVDPPLSYFTPALWASYAMWKNPETVLRKDRAHFAWERAAAD